VLVFVVKYRCSCCFVFIAFSATKTEQEGTYDSAANDGNPYESMSPNDDIYSGMEVYDDIDEPSNYTALHEVEPKEETKEEDIGLPTEAPEPPPMRQHEYLELVNL